MKRFSKITPKAIDQFTAYIKNSGTMDSESLIRKAVEMGYNPYDLIDASLGSVRYDKSAAYLEDPIEDILNDIYEKDPTPGHRYVLDPNDVQSKKAKEIAKSLGNDLGVSQTLNFGRSRSLPNFAVVKKPKTWLEKLVAITTGGHELEHNTDKLIRPDYNIKTPESYQPGHHYKGIYETRELVREINEIPEDSEITSEIKKQSKKAGLKPSAFTRLRSLLGPIGAGFGVYSALKSGDALAAGLEAASAVDPTGISDAALEVNTRLKMSPEERKKASREDFLSAMPMDIANEQRLLDELEEPPKKKGK